MGTAETRTHIQTHDAPEETPPKRSEPLLSFVTATETPPRKWVKAMEWPTRMEGAFHPKRVRPVTRWMHSSCSPKVHSAPFQKRRSATFCAHRRYKGDAAHRRRGHQGDEHHHKVSTEAYCQPIRTGIEEAHQRCDPAGRR